MKKLLFLLLVSAFTLNAMEYKEPNLEETKKAFVEAVLHDDHTVAKDLMKALPQAIDEWRQLYHKRMQTIQRIKEIFSSVKNK